MDELAHTNAPGSKHQKRYEDVLELLEHGISVITACNVQHLESLNDVVARLTGARARATIPDSFLQRADAVVNVDVSVDTLRTRLRQGKIYGVEKIEQALNNFFRKGNLCALREQALRQVAQDQAAKAHDYREREGLGPAALPEKVMVCLASRGNAKKLLRGGSRIAGRLASDWFAVYVETPREEPGRSRPEDHQHLQENLRLARELGARIIELQAGNVAAALIEFTRRAGITQVIFGQSALALGNFVARFGHQPLLVGSARRDGAGCPAGRTRDGSRQGPLASAHLRAKTPRQKGCLLCLSLSATIRFTSKVGSAPTFFIYTSGFAA